MNSNNTSTHESVKNNLLEAFIAKRDEYPDLRTDAIALLNKYDERRPPLTAASDGTAFAQKDTTYNKLSIDLGVGASNVVSSNFSQGYGQKLFDPLTVRVGARYMFNNIFGAAWVLGYDNISSSKKSIEFQTNNISSTLQAYASLTNLLNFSEFTDKFGLLIHTGAGLSTMNGKLNNIKVHDNVISFIGGINSSNV